MLLLKIKMNLLLLLPKNYNLFNLIHFSSSTSSSASKTLSPSPESNPIAEYLIKSCGFSSQTAATASKRIRKFTSVEQAASVRHFFKHHGLADTAIRQLISNYPRVLCSDVEKTLQPNLHAVREMGFTDAELKLLIVSNPYVLETHLAIPRLEFWQTFIGTNNRKDLVLVFRENRSLIGQDIFTGIIPKITLLKEHGLSDAHIVKLMKKARRLILRSFETIEALLNKTMEMGFDPKSPMFLHGLASVSNISTSHFARKEEFFKGFGWSEEEFLAAIRKAPFFILLKDENIQGKMEFLVGRVGCQQSYIASNPLLLMFSLEKRLKPRHYVMEVLKSNEIPARWGLYTIMSLSEKKFVEIIIFPYKEQVPKLHDIYIAACAGQFLI